jgi:hypothetical protein
MVRGPARHGGEDCWSQGRHMNDHDVFVAAGCSAGALRAAIEAALGTSFEQGQGSGPVPALLAGATKVFYYESHPFEDDVVDFAVSRYCFWVSVHNSARNSGRQLAGAAARVRCREGSGLAGEALLRRPGPNCRLPVRPASDLRSLPTWGRARRPVRPSANWNAGPEASVRTGRGSALEE